MPTFDAFYMKQKVRCKFNKISRKPLIFCKYCLHNNYQLYNLPDLWEFVELIFTFFRSARGICLQELLMNFDLSTNYQPVLLIIQQPTKNFNIKSKAAFIFHKTTLHSRLNRPRSFSALASQFSKYTTAKYQISTSLFIILFISTICMELAITRLRKQ